MLDIIDMESFDAGFSAGYKECLADRRQRIHRRKENKIAKRKRFLYFMIQKMIGILLLISTVFMVKLCDGDIAVAFLMVPIGLTLIFSKELYFLDRYYLKTEGTQKQGNARHNI